LDQRKREELRNTFQWGRRDETNCQMRWTLNLPGFDTLGAEETNIPQRCQFAGREIREKMMDRNGFTAREANVLIGAHTIGLTRNVFGPEEVAPWVRTGRDAATLQGPIFDNSYHKFLVDSIFATTVDGFAQTRFPFDEDFPNWFKSNPINVNHLDTDVVMAFPSTDTNVHPHFDAFSREFAASNTEFINSFMAALNKMSRLGVRVQLQSAIPSCATVAILGDRPGDGSAPVASPVSPLPDFDTALLASVDVAQAMLNETLVDRQADITFLTTPVVGAGP
jgi:hypothetical protein